MKGCVFPTEHSCRADRISGAKIHQITQYPAIHHPTYFLQSSFTPDDRTIIFTSYRTGSAQLFEAAFPDGGLRQLTDGPAIHPFSPAIHPDGDRVFFVRGGSFWVIDRTTLEERLIVEFQDAQLGEGTLSPDGKWLAAAVKDGTGPGIATGRADGTGWRIIRFGRTVIHPQFHPLEPAWIEFAGDPAPRIHRVRRDGTGMECLYEHGNDEFVVHETFLGRTGDLVFTVWPRLLCRMDWQTRQISTIAEFNAWHITPNRAGTRVLCDTNHPDRGIFLIDVDSGAPRFLCLSESSNRGSQWEKSSYALAEDFAAAAGNAVSWMEVAADTVYGPQWTHPHPSFSHREQLVAFASDRSGTTQVYVAEIGDSEKLVDGFES
jgi:hypothetical protein